MELQWRGIVIVLIILCDVILFAVVFVFQDNTVVAAKENSQLAMPWVKCLMATGGDKNSCLEQANGLVVSLPSVTATFMLLAVSDNQASGLVGFVGLTCCDHADEWTLADLAIWAVVHGDGLGRVVQGAVQQQGQEGRCEDGNPARVCPRWKAVRNVVS